MSSFAAKFLSFRKIYIGLIVLAASLFYLLQFTSVFGAGQPPKANLDQAHNGSAASPNTPVDWSNGNANENNSHYVEGLSIPYRIVLSNLSAGSHTVEIEWDVKHSGAHAIDYITTYNRLEPHSPFGHTAEAINPIEGTSATGPPASFAIPAPSSTGSPVSGQPAADFNSLPAATERLMSLWNGTITSMSYVSQGDLNVPNSSTRLSITFTVANANADAVLAWGGHIAKESVWGEGNSAGGISGSPYHSRIISLDGVGGNQDRSLSAAAVIPTPQGSITLDKVTAPAGDSQSFSFTTTGLPSPTSPSLTDQAAPIVWSALENGTYTITENAASGWDLTSKSCTGATQGTVITPTATGLSISLANGDQLTCTFANTKRAQIIVDKVTNPSGDQQGFGFTTTGTGYNGFNLTDQASPNSQSVVPGSYSVSESAVSGWTQTSATCNNNQSPNAITVTAGQTITCTFTNGKLPKLTLVKTVSNDNGGTLGVSNFPLFINGQSVTSGASSSLAPGNYTASETNQAGYTPSAWESDCAGDGTITLSYGDDKTCTITNNDDAPSLTLKKAVVKDNGGTATESDWTLTAAGPTGFSGAGPTVLNGASFDIGSYNLSEAGPAGYSASAWVCVGGTQNDSDTITVGLGQSATCTITNDDIAPRLTLVKTVTKDNGGTALPTDWTLAAAGTTPISGTTGGGSVTNAAVSTGVYNLSETGGPAGYTASTYSCVKNGGAPVVSNSITLGLADNATCTINNNDNTPTLILNKIVVNDNGGTASESDWTLNAAGPTALSGLGATGDTDVASGSNFSAGTYTLFESTGPTGYSASAWTCVGGIQAGSNITLALGETATCTITNDDQQAFITVNKVVTNDNGGSAAPDSFNLTLAGNSTTSGTPVPVSPGTYTAGETQQSGYTFEGFSGDCGSNGATAVALGESKTCTLTNNDQQAYVIVDKTVINDNGGSAEPDNFLLTVDGLTALDGVAVPVNPGSHTAGETNLPGYNAGEWGGDCSAIATVVVALGETKTCTITNDDTPGTLKIVKNTTGGDEQFNFTVAGPTASTPSITSSNGTGSVGPSNVNAGTYSVTETVPDGWTLSSATCDDGSPVASLQISLGENVVCTFTNVKKPRLTIVKVTNPTTDDGKFNLSINGTPYATDVGNGGSTNAQFAAIGANTFGEAAGANTDLANYVSVVRGEGCGGSATAGTITLAAGDDKTCTITNTRKGRIIVDKVTNPAGDQQSFDFAAIGDAGYASFSLTDAAAPNNQQVAPGAYSVSEGAVAGWDSDGGVCNQGESPASLDVEPGETVTCTFTNTKRGSLTIVKDAQPNDLIDFQFGGGLGNFLLDDDADVVGIGANGDIDQPQSKVFPNLVPASYGVSETMPNPFWTFGGVSCVLTGTNTPYSSTTNGTGVTVTINPGADVTCTFVNTKQSPTRTQGFWQTHTAYTTNVFNTKFNAGNPLFVGVNSSVGSGTHKGILTDRSQLFGAYFSNIAKKTDGKQRTATDKARMVLLQQLVTAKLNCAEFGCASSVRAMIAAADTAYAGENKTAMTTSTSALDAYNNSGDTITIGNAGKATPTTSKSIANYAFWDAP